MLTQKSKSVPRISSETYHRKSFKLPTIIHEKKNAKIEYASLTFNTTANTKKLRTSKNDQFDKQITLEAERSLIVGKLKDNNPRRRSILYSPILQVSRSMKKQPIKVEMQEVYRCVNKLICLDFQLYLDNKTNTVELYKGKVDKGNNSFLIKHLLKSRGYCNIKGVIEDTDNTLIWTQYRQKNIISIKTTRQQFKGIKKIQFTKQMKNYLSQFKNIFKLFVMPQDIKDEFSIGQIKDIIKQLTSKPNLFSLSSKDIRLTNHLPNQQQLSNKKSLFQNLNSYYSSKNIDPFQFIPVTFHVTSSTSDPQFSQFVQYCSTNNKNQHLWIIKPGQFTNRGNGIVVEQGTQGVKKYIQSLNTKHTSIIQLYITPYLYHQRKFDIRCYLLVVMMNNSIKGYWYEQGYIRTSSETFSYKNMDKMIHLTNDAIQKYGQNYGKHQAGNKVSYSQLQKYIQNESKIDFRKEIVPKMRQLAKDALSSTKQKLGAQRLQQGFEIFGLDFMLDDQLKPWLIEFNTNPCLQTGVSLLSRLIPQMLQNAFRVALDPFIIDGNHKLTPGFQCFVRNNKFQLIYKD